MNRNQGQIIIVIVIVSLIVLLAKFKHPNTTPAFETAKGTILSLRKLQQKTTSKNKTLIQKCISDGINYDVYPDAI